MNQNPALIKAAAGKYHITDQPSGEYHLARCGRQIAGMVERHAVDILHAYSQELGDFIAADQRCPRCGSAADFAHINAQRQAEDAAQQADHQRVMREIAELRVARCAARPALTSAVMELLTGATAAIVDPSRETEVKPYPNMDQLRIPVIYQGQQFTIRVDVWNGDHQ